MHRGGVGAARVERGLLQRATANQLPHELTGMHSRRGAAEPTGHWRLLLLWGRSKLTYSAPVSLLEHAEQAEGAGGAVVGGQSGSPWPRFGHGFLGIATQESLRILGRSPRSPQPQPTGLVVHGRWVMGLGILISQKRQPVSRDRCVHIEMHSLCVFLDLLQSIS